MYLILLIYSQHNGQDGKRKSTHSLESIRKQYSVINKKRHYLMKKKASSEKNDYNGCKNNWRGSEKISIPMSENRFLISLIRQVIFSWCHILENGQLQKNRSHKRFANHKVAIIRVYLVQNKIG